MWHWLYTNKKVIWHGLYVNKNELNNLPAKSSIQAPQDLTELGERLDETHKLDSAPSKNDKLAATTSNFQRDTSSRSHIRKYF
jgi:hypothetical protein